MGTLGKELDLELVRLEILVDSLQEMEEQLNLNEQQEDSMSEYQSSEDGDLSSAREVGSGPGGLGVGTDGRSCWLLRRVLLL